MRKKIFSICIVASMFMLVAVPAFAGKYDAACNLCFGKTECVCGELVTTYDQVDCKTNIVQKGFNVVGGTILGTKWLIGGTAKAIVSAPGAIICRKCKDECECIPMAQSCPPPCPVACPKPCPDPCVPACPKCSQIEYRFVRRARNGYPSWEPHKVFYY